MFATTAIIKKAIMLKVNFIIACEPTFYNHLGDTAWLKNDKVYQYKASLLQDNHMAVWRNHYYIHSHLTDGVKSALVSNLGWTAAFYN